MKGGKKVIRLLKRPGIMVNSGAGRFKTRR